MIKTKLFSLLYFVMILTNEIRVLCSKPLGGFKVDSAFHSFEIDKMSTKNFWELSGKK